MNEPRNPRTNMEMMMQKYRATVTFEVEVQLDETKFDEAFMSEFRKHFFSFHDIADHVEHLAQLEARGLLEDFTEGYGPIGDMGIKAATLDWEVDDVRRIHEPARAA